MADRTTVRILRRSGDGAIFTWTEVLAQAHPDWTEDYIPCNGPTQRVTQAPAPKPVEEAKPEPEPVAKEEKPKGKKKSNLKPKRTEEQMREQVDAAKEVDHGYGQLEMKRELVMYADEKLGLTLKMTLTEDKMRKKLLDAETAYLAEATE